jgi:hypothetical protein
MPYSNEHSARIKEPGDFESDSFRRVNDKFGAGIDAIFGRLKGETTLTVQAIRFDAKKFTAAEARKWLKDHDYKALEFEPAKKEEAMTKKIQRGKPLEELVKGSEVVELVDQPQSPAPLSPAGTSPQLESTIRGREKRKGKRLEERNEGVKIILEETAEGGKKHIKANDVIVAGMVNGNGRRYPVPVVRAAVEEARGHLHESLGQGRAILLGEAEHPSDKAARRPNLLETVVAWDEISFDGRSVGLGGNILGTSRGKDIQALMEGGVMPGVSLRGYGETKSIKEDEQRIEEVTECHITGFDLVLEPSFEQAQAVLESIQKQSEEEMDLDELLKLLKEHPEAFAGITEAQVKTMGETQLKKLEETLRGKLGLDANADIGKALEEAMSAKNELTEQKRKTAVEKLITEATKDLPYGKFNANFIESVKAANPQDEAAVKSLVEAKRKEYDVLFSADALKKMGFTGKIQGIQSVLENETGTPEYARGAFELTESIRKVEMHPRRNLKEAKTRAELFTQQLLERFDALHKPKLMAESRMLEEAEQVSDLSLPYSVSRAIIEEAFPNLVAANIFDVGVMTNSPERLYYETFSGETGYTVAAAAEAVVALLDTWVDLDYKRITPGTLVAKNHAQTVTYTEGTDYVIDHANGKFMALTGGSISGSQDIHITAYTYTAVRKGEMVAIERGKLTLAYKTIEAAADRLADQISREAVVFSRAQLGYDATARTLANLAKQLNRKIDQGMLYASISAVLSVANNSAGTWTEGTTDDDYDELVRLIGLAKVKVGNRYYAPTGIVCSMTNAERLGHWKGFTRAGQRPGVDELMGNGFIGSVNGLPVFWSTEFPDTFIEVVNQQLVMHRVFQPMQFNGPYPTYDEDGKLIAADQYYAEAFNATEAPVPEKGSYVVIAEGS